jgi:flagellar FliJ protein
MSTMNAPPALQTLLEHAIAQRDNALAAHRRALVALQGAQAQADQLVAHRRDTIERAGTRAHQTANLVMLQSYQGFMQRLDEAVAQQQARVDTALQRHHAAEHLLIVAEQRVASVTKLIEGRLALAGQLAARIEQKDNDEFASRMAWQREASPLRGVTVELPL